MNRNFRWFVSVVVVSCASTATAAPDAGTPPAACGPVGAQVGFFNGVWNTEAQAEWSMLELDEVPSPAVPPSSFTLFYNETGKGQSGTLLQDVFETFMQRANEQSTILGEHAEAIWEILRGDQGPSSITSRLVSAIPQLGTTVASLVAAAVSDKISSISALLASPPTLADYGVHRAKLDALLALRQRVVLVGHSQGNLFMNVAFDHGATRVGPRGLAAVHVAPASAKLNGEYTLANWDLVINGLRVTGSVPDDNVDIPEPLAADGSHDITGHELVETYLDQSLDTYGSVRNELNRALAPAFRSPPDNCGDAAVPPPISTPSHDAGADATHDAGSASPDASTPEHDAGTPAPPNPQKDAGSSTNVLHVVCDSAGRFHATITGSPTDEIVDTQTGRIWHRQNELVSGLHACELTGDYSRYMAHADPFCCSNSPTDPAYAECNQLGAVELCSKLGMRLPTLAELKDIQNITGSCDGLGNNCGACVLPWQSWSSTLTSTGAADYVFSNQLGYSSYGVTGPYGFDGVKCVQDP